MACFVLGKWGLAYFFETLHLREDEDERNEAEHGEGRPYNVKRYLAPEEGGDNGEEVTHCGGDKPTTPSSYPLYWGGATFETKEIPIGERSNSAKVRTR